MSLTDRAARAAALAALLAIAGCHKPAPKSADKVDADLVGNAADPALTGALADQIMVDPSLSQQANGKSVRAADAPAQAPVPPPATLAKGAPTPAVASSAPPAKATPCAGADCKPSQLTLGQLAALQHRKAAAAPTVAAADDKRCGPQTGAAALVYSARWAAKLPDGVPIYPGGQVSEAAGTDSPGCSLRVVTFTTPAPWHQVLDWYYAEVTKHGWTADHETRGNDNVLAGTRASGGAYYLVFTPQNRGGTQVDMIASADR